MRVPLPLLPLPLLREPVILLAPALALVEVKESVAVRSNVDDAPRVSLMADKASAALAFGSRGTVEAVLAPSSLMVGREPVEVASIVCACT